MSARDRIWQGATGFVAGVLILGGLVALGACGLFFVAAVGAAAMGELRMAATQLMVAWCAYIAFWASAALLDKLAERWQKHEARRRRVVWQEAEGRWWRRR